MITYRQLKKKLHRACLDSGLSDNEVIHALTETLLETIVFRSTGDQQLKQMAKSVVYDILDGVSVDTEAAKALCAELYTEGGAMKAREDVSRSPS